MARVAEGAAIVHIQDIHLGSGNWCKHGVQSTTSVWQNRCKVLTSACIVDRYGVVHTFIGAVVVGYDIFHTHLNTVVGDVDGHTCISPTGASIIGGMAADTIGKAVGIVVVVARRMISTFGIQGAVVVSNAVVVIRAFIIFSNTYPTLLLIIIPVYVVFMWLVGG
jgi:hypothetical protein